MCVCANGETRTSTSGDTSSPASSSFWMSFPIRTVFQTNTALESLRALTLFMAVARAPVLSCEATRCVHLRNWMPAQRSHATEVGARRPRCASGDLQPEQGWGQRPRGPHLSRRGDHAGGTPARAIPVRVLEPENRHTLSADQPDVQPRAEKSGARLAPTQRLPPSSSDHHRRKRPATTRGTGTARALLHQDNRIILCQFLPRICHHQST